MICSRTLTLVLAALFGMCSAFIAPSVSNKGASRRGLSVSMVEKSKAIPFLPRPAALDGSLVGDIGFDPLGFSSWFDVRYLREAELKHCRICMLAVVGFPFADFVKLPGDVHQVSSIEAHDAAVKFGGMGQLLLWFSLAEMLSSIAVVQMLQGSGRKPGEFGFDPLGFSKNAAAADDFAMKELANGRLAMLAFSGMVTQAVVTGKGFPYF